jgi:hypothetical protein
MICVFFVKTIVSELRCQSSVNIQNRGVEGHHDSGPTQLGMSFEHGDFPLRVEEMGTRIDTDRMEFLMKHIYLSCGV